MVKIKISYEKVQELSLIRYLLRKHIKTLKIIEEPQKPFKRAYITLNDIDTKNHN